jgi:hypothetical protein
MARDEQWFRDLLDTDGVLREEANLGLEEDASFRVFSQEAAPRVRSARWGEFAARFTDTRLGITTDKHYGAREVFRDAARVVLAHDMLRETRLVLVRPVTDADLRAADQGELLARTYGLATLARRCKTIVVVETQAATVGGDQSVDRAALLLSAILAGTELGPIVYPGASDIVGFKTAWMRFQKLAESAPYR